MTNSYDLSPDAALGYDEKKVPAIFGPLAEASLARLDLTGVASALDVACGSGIVVRALSEHLPQSVRIVGADLSAAMIAVAQARAAPSGHQVDWVVAPAEAMPLADADFDLVTCQQGLQFFPDRPAALAEMHRLLRPGGRIALTCWAGVPPLFATISRHLAERVSDRVAQIAVAPFAFSDAEMISALIGAAGFSVQPTTRIDVHRRIPATAAAISTELLASPNEATLKRLSDDTFADLVNAILDDLRDFRSADELTLPQSSWLFQATRLPSTQNGDAQ